jgi:hypothetical protein
VWGRIKQPIRLNLLSAKTRKYKRTNEVFFSFFRVEVNRKLEREKNGAQKNQHEALQATTFNPNKFDL